MLDDKQFQDLKEIFPVLILFGVGIAVFFGRTFQNQSINHRAKIVALFDLTYQLFDWLWLTAGVSHVASQLDSSSGFYSPYGPGRTAIFFDLTVPVDGIIQAVQGR